MCHHRVTRLFFPAPPHRTPTPTPVRLSLRTDCCGCLSRSFVPCFFSAGALRPAPTTTRWGRPRATTRAQVSAVKPDNISLLLPHVGRFFLSRLTWHTRTYNAFISRWLQRGVVSFALARRAGNGFRLDVMYGAFRVSPHSHLYPLLPSRPCFYFLRLLSNQSTIRRLPSIGWYCGRSIAGVCVCCCDFCFFVIFTPLLSPFHSANNPPCCRCRCR